MFNFFNSKHKTGGIIISPEKEIFTPVSCSIPIFMVTVTIGESTKDYLTQAIDSKIAMERVMKFVEEWIPVDNKDKIDVSIRYYDLVCLIQNKKENNKID